MARTRSKLVTGAVAVLSSTIGLVGTASPSGAATLTCGQTITQSTVLESDVGPCPANGGNGINVGADDITLDLNGHTVFGSPAATGDGAGVYLFRRTGVTVRNGTVRDFDGGVAIEGGSRNTVTAIAARDNIGVVGVTKYDDGIAILSSTNNRITRNTAAHNGPLSGIGIYSRVDSEHARTTSGISSGNLVEYNQVVDNNLPRAATINDSDGIRVETMSTGNIVSRNRSTGAGLDGISIFSFAPGNTVQYNQVANNGFLNPARRRGDGIRVFGGSDHTLVVGNQVTGNAANGIILHGVFHTPSGVRPPVTDSTVTDNRSVNNSLLPPIEQSELGGPTFDLLDGNPDCDNNVWLRNSYRTASPPCTTTQGHQV